MHFDLNNATQAQRMAINAAAELHGGMGISWNAGPFGQAFAEIPDSTGKQRYFIVDREGALSMRSFTGYN